MKFSVITPAYNGLEKMKRAVGSIRGQENVDIEHLVQDAASTDGTPEWLQTQSGLEFQSEPDKGMYDAINKGWSRATGDVLSWLNVDEQYLPGTLARVQQVFESNPEVDVVFGNSIFTDPDGDPIAVRREIPLREAYVKNGFLYALSCTLFFRRKLWDEGLLKFDTSFKNAGDADVVLRLLQAGKKCHHIPEYLSLFGVDGENLSVTLADNMTREAALLCKKYGGANSALLRKGIMVGRYVERVAGGCYRPQDVSFQYAVSEVPDYVTKEGKEISGRFTYESAMRKMGV